MVYKNILISLFIAVLLFCSPTGVRAFEDRSGDAVRIREDEIIDGSLFLSGNRITVEGTINGDLYCAGQTVDITGVVLGDVMCAGQNVDIAGIIEGDLRVAGQNVTVGSDIAGSVTSFAQILNVGGTVGGDMLAGAQTLTLHGLVERDVRVYSQSLTVKNTTKIGRDLLYTSEETAVIEDGSVISGKSEQVQPDQNILEDKQKPAMQWPRAAGFVSKILFSFIITYLAARYGGKRLEHAVDVMKNRWLTTSLSGFLVLIGIPIVMLLLAMTIIGIPFALFILPLYILGIMISKSLAAILTGRFIMHTYVKGKNKSSLPLITLTGVVVLELLFAIPFIGPFASLLITLWSLGGVYYFFKNS